MKNSRTIENRESEVYILKMATTKMFCSYKNKFCIPMRCDSNIFEKNLLFRNSLKSFIPKKTICVFYAMT